MTERVTRWCRGLASLALLVGLVVGVPAALLRLGGDPLPRTLDLRTLWALLLQPDDGTVLVRLLALVGWLAWAVFVLTLLAELVNLARRRRRAVVLPGLGGVQQWAAGLMLAVVALGGAAQLTSGPAEHSTVTARPAPAAGRSAPAEPAASDRAPAAPAASDQVPAAPAQAVVDPGDEQAHEAPDVAPAARAAPRGQRERIHVVVAGDDLWSLAERYYGRGQDWRRIARANPDRLTGGPDRLEVGWRLAVPEVAERSRSADAERPGRREVRVRPGDTMSSIAERVLGDADRWRELYRANRDQLSDPDELPVGLLLRMPGTAEASRAESDAPLTKREARTGSTDDAPSSEDAAPVPSPVPPSPPTTSTRATPEAVPGSTTASRGGQAPEATPSARTAPAAPSDQRDADQAEDDGPSLLVPGLATVGGLLAASLMGGLAARRRWQLQRRPVGRRIAHPPAVTRSVEVALAGRARPIGLRTLDRASRALAVATLEAGVDLPPLRGATVSPEWLVLELAGPTPPAPRCFVDTGGTWCLDADAAAGLKGVAGIGEVARPWPLLVTLGAEQDGVDRIVDLESLGLLAVSGDPGRVTAVMAAMALELACSPWTDELRLTLVGSSSLAPALGQHNVQSAESLDPVLDRLERAGSARREHAGGRAARDLRLDRDRAEAWTPEVVLVDLPVTLAQAERLARLSTSGPGTGLAVVVRGAVQGARATLALDDDGRATLQPDGVRLVPQALAAEGLEPVVALVGATGSEETDPAPWWSSDEKPEAPPDNVTYLGRRRRTDEGDEQERRAAVQARMTEAADGTIRHPLLQLLGPVGLVGATGTPPSRAARQCLEYCAWLLEHPGTTAQSMAAGLLVAEGTRRSNMSRLRTWLGTGDAGEPYLPDAYSGRIWLDPVVSSDWHQLRLLLADGVDRASSSVLELGLRLVRGAPLADAAPVQWHWAEALRTDMISCIRDMGVELTRRALDERDLDLARWAAARALLAAPGDELLLVGRIRTEHLARNATETERLCLQLAQQARAVGVDLDPATVDLIQEVMEGRVRARLA